MSDPVLRLSGIKKAYNSGKPNEVTVLNGIDLEVARGEEVAANVWSKLFPAMIVIMALTGAFYPAIDLGAGKEPTICEQI